MPSPPHDFQAELDTIAAIPAVDTILEVVCRTTGMGLAAIARVTDERCVCCAVKDTIAFGLKPGGELKVETTICDQIRASREPVAIDHVAQDRSLHSHPAPAMYGFQSYIAVPILMPDGSLFGTLCAIDPRPKSLNNPAVLGMFKLFAELVAFHLDIHVRLAVRQKENERLQEQFRAGLGHDIRNTLAAMDAGTRLLRKTPLDPRATLIVAEMQTSTQKLSRQIAEVMQAPKA